MKVNAKEMMVYDFGNLTCQGNENNNLGACDSCDCNDSPGQCDCNCDCDSDDCDCNDFCDNED